MIEYLKKAFEIPDVRKKLIATFAVLALYRFLSHVPIPNVNIEAVRVLFETNKIFATINLFSGGGLSRVSIVSLGVGPYITASIFIQLLTMVVPKLEEMSKEGTTGRQQLNRYTQALTVPLSLIQGYGIYFLLAKNTSGIDLLTTPTPFNLVLLVLVMAAGSFLLMWIAQLITEYGVGNGTSVIIFAGILAGIPASFLSTFTTVTGTQWLNIAVFAAVAVAVITGVVYVNEAYRKIEVQYSSRMKGSRLLGGGSSYIPIKINQAGVIPIIFAVSLIFIPSIIATALQNNGNARLADIGTWMSLYFASGAVLYIAFYFLLVFVFTYFYTAVTFNPEKIADEIRKSGGFVPGVRPGKATQDYLRVIINRLTFAGGIFLGAIAVSPSIVQNMTGITSLSIGGTGILIVVSVVLETVKQIESQVITREYDTFTR